MPHLITDAPEPEAFASPVLAATLVAAAMVAQQVIGKATRDAMFLAHFPVARLPFVLIAGSMMSSAVVWLAARLLARSGPARIVPIAFAVHGALLLVEWALASRFEPAIALVFYVHTIALGASLASAFWAAVGEGFDPHTAKQVVGRIAAGAALGGAIGGGIAWGASKVASVPTMLAVMAALSGVCAWGAARFARTTHASHARAAEPARSTSGLTALRQTPYLRLLAIIVALGALTQSLLDYALGAQATATYGSGARLLAFFAIFQTSVGLVSFVVQLAVNRLALDRLGVGGTMALLPGGIVALGAVALGAPSLVTVALQRGAEAVLRASLFRSAYEVLFTPVAQALKRPTKTMIDVSFDRVGVMAGSALTLGVIAFFPHDALRVVMVATVIAAAFQLAVAYRLHKGYIVTLAERLRAGTLVLDPANVVDATTRATLSRTLQSLDRHALLAQIEALRLRGDVTEAPPSVTNPEYPELETESETEDDLVRALIDLRDEDAVVVRLALQRGDARILPLALPILDLLERDDLAEDVARALAPLVPRIIGTIVDVVLDDERAPSTRRRAARLLMTVSSQRAASALESALDAGDLGVRYACGRVLSGMRETSTALHFDAEATEARARRELEGAQHGGARSARTLEHAFNVLSLTFPREPMQLAYGAVVGSDRFLRGVALEYLDAVLPADLRAALTPWLGTSNLQTKGVSRPARPPLDDLLQSKDAIHVSLDALRRAHDPDRDG